MPIIFIFLYYIFTIHTLTYRFETFVQLLPCRCAKRAEVQLGIQRVHAVDIQVGEFAITVTSVFDRTARNIVETLQLASLDAFRNNAWIVA